MRLKIMTFFQGPPSRGPFDIPGDPQKWPYQSEAESEASSEDLVLPPDAEVALDGTHLDRNEEEAERRRKKKPKGLANMISALTKGRKKKGLPSSVEPQRPPEPQAGVESKAGQDPLPTAR
ncbi:PREDICTED: tumor necrosis factor alpha-induced protein 2-like [Condylura cristata]|uniref:tumor necrosis factor alpha-induced protein 2-like n=1 Tax=Condylura cristata TaxID=143302 RepID=UPI000643C398|nr:PREDICTED: tumor necrosis factor alpha-induced protein 2-like [Condylura cristata]